MIRSVSAGKPAPRAAFVAALEFAVRTTYDETLPAAAPASDRPRRATVFTAGRLGEIVALCSVAAVLAGTAARTGPHAAAISTPTHAAATDTATPVVVVATPVVSARP